MTVSLLYRMDTDYAKLEKNEMKKKLHVLDRSDELKINNNESAASKDLSGDRNEENLFLLNVENEITAYSISKQSLDIYSKTLKKAEQRDLLTNSENEISVHAICKPKDAVEGETHSKAESRLNYVNMANNVTKDTSELQNRPRLKLDNGFKAKEINTYQQNFVKPNRPTFKVKKRHRNVEENPNKDVYEGLEYLLEDEDIVLQNKAAEKYIIVDKGEQEDLVSVQDGESRLSDKDPESSNLGASERKRRKIENQRVIKKVIPNESFEDMYGVLWETASNTRLPSLLWSVHKASDESFVAFSHVSPFSSDLKFIVDKAIIFGKDRHPVIFLRNVKVTISNLPEVLEAPEHISSMLRRIDKLVLCLGYGSPMEKYSSKCCIYFERVGNSLTCHECLLELKLLQVDGRSKDIPS